MDQIPGAERHWDWSITKTALQTANKNNGDNRRATRHARVSEVRCRYILPPTGRRVAKMTVLRASAIRDGRGYGHLRSAPPVRSANGACGYRKGLRSLRQRAKKIEAVAGGDLECGDVAGESARDPRRLVTVRQVD